MEISDEVYINSMSDISKYFQIMLDNKDKKIADLQSQLDQANEKLNEHNEYFKAFNCKDFKEFQDFISSFMLTPHEEQTLIKDLQNQLNQANERLKVVGLAKFELGQEVFVFDWDKQIRSGRIYEIQTNAVLHDIQPHITYLVDFTGNYSDDDQENDYYEEKNIYATEEEINAKLQELRGDKK